MSRFVPVLRQMLFAASLIGAAASPALAETIAITGGRVVPGDGSPSIANGTVIVRDGRIVAVGANVPVPADARRIDASGQWVTPGLVAGFSRVGLVEVGAVKETNDSAFNSQRFSAALDVSTALNPDNSAIDVSRTAGLTRAIVAPDARGSIFAGQGAIIDLGADRSPLTMARAFQFVELGERGSAMSGGSRAGAHLRLKAMLREARQYAAGADSFDDDLLSAEDAKALQAVLNGDVRLLVHVESATDIEAVLGLVKDYPGIKLVLVGASEGWRVADKIAAARVPVIASALNDLPERFEILAATQSNIGRMRAAGVVVALGMIDDNDAHQIRYAAQYAGNLVALTKVPGATGLSWDQAFATIASAPAEVMGQGGKFGVLRSGAAGDVVVWDGDPLELSSAPVTVLIDGVQQPLDNRQTRLRDRYRTPQEGALPKAYE